MQLVFKANLLGINHPLPIKVSFLLLCLVRALYLVAACFRTRQRSRESVVRGNGLPKGWFGESVLFSAPSRFAPKTPENLRINFGQKLKGSFYQG